MFCYRIKRHEFDFFVTISSHRISQTEVIRVTVEGSRPCAVHTQFAEHKVSLWRRRRRLQKRWLTAPVASFHWFFFHIHSFFFFYSRNVRSLCGALTNFRLRTLASTAFFLLLYWINLFKLIQNTGCRPPQLLGSFELRKSVPLNILIILW